MTPDRKQGNLSRRDFLKVAITGGVSLALAACQLGERFGQVTPPPEGTATDPTEVVPALSVELGRILDFEKDQSLLSPEIKKEFANFTALHSELEGRDVYKFAIQSPIGPIGFATYELKPEEIEKAIIAQSQDGKTAVSIPDRALYTTVKDVVSGEYGWSRLLGVAVPGADEGSKIISWFYLPEGYPKPDETTPLDLDYPVLAYQMPNNGELLFWYPIMANGKPTWSSDYQMAMVASYNALPEGVRNVLFSLLPVEPTPTPEPLPPLPSEFLSQIPADKQYEIANGQVLVDGQAWFEINSNGEWEKIQRTITFDLEIGGTMEMFRFDTPKEGFEYMVNKDGIFWGETDLTRTSEDTDFFMKKIFKIPGVGGNEFMSGISLPNNIDSSKFQIMVYGAGDGAIIVYRADEGNLKAIYIDEIASTVFAWTSQYGRSLILPKPQP